jgi:hypothetical protein
MQSPHSVHRCFAGAMVAALLLGNMQMCQAAGAVSSPTTGSVLQAAQRAKGIVETSQEEVVKSLEAIGTLVSGDTGQCVRTAGSQGFQD